MEAEEALEQPDICSQDSPMKTFSSELNTLKRHFPTVKSVNGESPNSNIADIASVVNTIKAVSAACQRKGLEEHKMLTKGDAITDHKIESDSFDENEKLIGNGQTSQDKGEPETKRVKLSDEGITNDTKSNANEEKSEILNQERDSVSGNNHEYLVETEETRTCAENEQKLCVTVDTCSLKPNCNCKEEPELKLQIDATPEKNESQNSELQEKLKKPEDCFTPIKNHQCSSEEARKSPFLIGDKIRNSLKGIVEKVKSTPDHKKNLFFMAEDQDKGYFRNDKDTIIRKSEMSDSATKICDSLEDTNTSNITEMTCVQSKNTENDSVTDQKNYIPPDSVKLKEADAEIFNDADEQELLQGIEDGTHMDISSDKENELLEESSSDTEMNNESVVYLGEEINGHDNETSDLTSKKVNEVSKEGSQVSGNLESNFSKFPTTAKSTSASRTNSQNCENVNMSNELEGKENKSVGSISKDLIPENIQCSNEKMSATADRCEVNNIDSNNSSPKEVNTNNNLASSNEVSAENSVSKNEVISLRSSFEEDDIIFEGYDSPKPKYKEGNSSIRTDSNQEKSSEAVADIKNLKENLSSLNQRTTKNEAHNKTIPSVDSDVALIPEADLLFENDSENNSDKEQFVKDKNRTESVISQNQEMETDMETDQKTNKMDEDDDDDDVIFEGVVKAKASDNENSSKDSKHSENLNDKEKVFDADGKFDESTKSSADETKCKDDNFLAFKQNKENCKLNMIEDEENDEDDDVIFEGEDKPDEKEMVVKDQPVSKTEDKMLNSEKHEDKNIEVNKAEITDQNKDAKPNEAKLDSENSNQKQEPKSLKRPAEANSDQNSNPKRTRLDEVIGKLGSQIGLEPESIEVSESEEEEEESATDTALEEKSEDTTTSDNDDEETETASDNEKVKFIRITEKQLEELIQERVAAYLASQRETLLAQMTQRIKNLNISNDQWKNQVKEVQVKVTDLTVLNMKHEKRKAATAALKQITTRSVAVQVDEGKEKTDSALMTASASKPSTQKSEPPANLQRTPPRRPVVQQKSPTPLVTAPPGSNGTIRLPIPQSSIAPPVFAAQMPQLPQQALVSTTQYPTPSVKSLLDTTRQQITSGSLTKTTPAISVQYPTRVVAQSKMGYVTVNQSVPVTAGVTMAAKTVTPSAQIPSSTGLKVIDLTVDDTDNRQPKMVALPTGQMQNLNQLRPVMQPQQQFVLSPNGQLIQTSPVGSTGQQAFQLVFNSASPAVRASIAPTATVLQTVPQQNVTMTTPVGTQQLVSQVPGLPTTSSTQISSLLSQTKSKEIGTPHKGQSQAFEEHIRPALRKKLETTVNVPAVSSHPAPLPSMPSSQVSAEKLLPPKPFLKISRVTQGIVLSWNMTVNDTHAEIASYQLFAYQESNSPPSTALWKKVGDVKALPLPMACTLTQFQVGNKYHFAVRAVDTHNRVGQFSEYSSIHLTPVTAPGAKS